MTRFFFFLFLIPFIGLAQPGSKVQKKYYSNGKVALVATEHGKDTFELKKYYQTGQIKDSLWLYIDGKEEYIIGTEKNYYANGRLASVTHHGKDWDEYTMYAWWENGQLERFEQSPTGLKKQYNKQGKRIRQHDYNNRKQIYISKKYRKRRHLKGTSFAKRITSTHASLFYTSQKKLKCGALISIYSKRDTTEFDHCQVEGFSKDTLYLSKFKYNDKYDRVNDKQVMKYDSTFAIAFNRLDSIYYSKHANRRRSAAALSSAMVGGIAILVPVGLLPFKIKDAIDGNLDVQSSAITYGAALAIGIPMVCLSNHLSRSMVPKKYDMHIWRIIVK